MVVNNSRRAAAPITIFLMAIFAVDTIKTSSTKNNNMVRFAFLDYFYGRKMNKYMSVLCLCVTHLVRCPHERPSNGNKTFYFYWSK